MRRSFKYFTRKIHRYLGLFIGIQFLGWTISGLFFSWNDLDRVHGDHLRKPQKAIPANLDLVSPTVVLGNLKKSHPVDSLKSVQLIRVLENFYYQVAYFVQHGNHSMLHFVLVDAKNGELRTPLVKVEAEKMATDLVKAPASIEKIEYLTEVGNHHEYRERRLPAWAVTFSKPACTVYLSAEMGTYQTIRHNQWRVFDFLWMFHTMDYAGRDNFNNWLLKLFSLFGLFTILSGFMLYMISSKTFYKIKKQL
ncbi:PepSY domain-containing protein [Flexithrix dorotheae]|uniref:PepSY domain-containing protein n=1 Tax=Flexithrix dorotheae TaxID=70993 RepID=UPI0003A90ABA|nr:PepSY domain-containing protein [Flexithrix dorotheae]